MHEDTQKILSQLKTSLESPAFADDVFSLLVQLRKEKNEDPLKKVILEEYRELSKRFDLAKLQDSCSVRNVLKTRRLAHLLIDDKGVIQTQLLPKLIDYQKQALYSLGPNRQFDAKRNEHILKILSLLFSNKEIFNLIKNLTRPLSNKTADIIIRETLQLSPSASLTDAHAKRAVLSGLLCYLRQSVGSCFATAPAIMIHTEQPEQFLRDINELLNTGQLKRTFGGVEYTVPLSSSWGAGDLRKLFMLPRNLEDAEIEIWQSPALIGALKIANILSDEQPAIANRKELKNILFTILQEWPEHDSQILVNVEILLEKIFLRHYSITEKDVQAYFERPQAMVYSGLLMQTPLAAAKSGGKGASVAHYLSDLETARNHFKSFADNALLKSWEFTLASLCDVKTDFSRWNLYSSLGMEAQEPGGIGSCLYQNIQQKLTQTNAQVASFQGEYEQAYSHIKYLEARLRNASTEKELQWIRAEYQSKINEFRSLEEIRNNLHAKAQAYANLYNVLIEAYLELFPRYFQEVYDPDMHDARETMYDDSPAGFRLLYKHGRANTSLWSKIYTPTEFVQYLTSFFVMTENEIIAHSHVKGLETDVSEIITQVVNHIKTKEFLESAFYRMARMHNMPAIRDPLEHLDQIPKKPWAYVSGGTIDTLLSCYFKREQPPTKVQRWMESPIELLTFLVDVAKQIPYKQMEDFLKRGEKKFIMVSPTHAFLFQPTTSPFRKGWENEAYTYVWIRDNWILPSQRFVENLRLDDDMMRSLLEKIKLNIPKFLHHRFDKVFERLPPSLTSVEFRQFVLDHGQSDRGLRMQQQSALLASDVDSALYQTVPVFKGYDLGRRVAEVVEALSFISTKEKKEILGFFNELLSSSLNQQVFDAKSLREIILALVSIEKRCAYLAFDAPFEISKVLQAKGFSLPAPILFADTNWVKDYFGLLVSPGTGNLEMWRLDYMGSQGAPMSQWEGWLNGSHREPQWGIYTRPYEYTI